MTAPALPVVTRRLCHDECHLDRVAQADEAVAQLGLAVKGLGLVLQVVQLTDGSALIGLSEIIEIQVTVDLIVNDVSLDSSTVLFKPEDFPVGSAIPTRYTCEGDTLTT